MLVTTDCASHFINRGPQHPTASRPVLPRHRTEIAWSSPQMPQMDSRYPEVRIRWRHIIRNFTIRNRDSHRLIFLNFLLRVKELVNSDCRFGFCMKNCIYSQLEMPRVLDFDPKLRNVQTLVPKNAISYHTSPPYDMDKHTYGKKLQACVNQIM